MAYIKYHQFQVEQEAIDFINKINDDMGIDYSNTHQHWWLVRKLKVPIQMTYVDYKVIDDKYYVPVDDVTIEYSNDYVELEIIEDPIIQSEDESDSII